MQETDSGAGPRTLRRGLMVLAALRDQGPRGLSVTDIARQTGIQRPTIYRLLAALLDAGLVVPLQGTKKYRTQLAADADLAAPNPRVRQMLPVLRRLADRTGDAVFLVVRDGDDSVSLHREIGSYPVQILATYAGKRQPLGVGSGSMALLAALPGALGVGCALLDAQGAPVLAVSVTAIIDRMPAQRQREIAGWIGAELARLAPKA
ncbi:helix-turn-helix domain-containing protein [Bordetella pertussis]|uniref:helix-turn-helix domain-containing protein n=1 Tax=Bordetella pertussis TaxID=520 RepID=UPI00320A309D